MEDITGYLAAARQPGSKALAAVFGLLYDELRALAGARARAAAPGATITTTALVHEAYLKLIQAQHLELADRKHFFACAAQAMRQIVLDHARSAMAAKRGGALEAVTLPTSLGTTTDPAQWLDLDTALEELERFAPELRELVELRYFAGLSREEVAELLDQSVRTVHRNWRRARAFLHARLSAGPGAEPEE